MGKGIETARAVAPEHAAAVDDFKDQLLLVLIKRLGGTVDIPVAEVDGMGRHVLMLSIVDGHTFHFELRDKQ